MISPANHVPLSPLSFLARARRVFPEKVAVVDGDGTPVSYAEFGRDCDALAGALRADDVRAGDRVAVLDFNSRWLLAAHFGVPGARGALVALNTRLAVEASTTTSWPTPAPRSCSCPLNCSPGWR